jgi:hypothetical protein
MIRLMSEDDIGEIRDELKVYKAQIDALREDLKIVVKYSPQLRTEVLGMAMQADPLLTKQR